MSGINRTASLIETPCLFRQPWVSRRKSNMIATRRIFSVLVLLLVSTSWSLFAEPKTNRKADDKSSSGVSNDSYRGLSGEELWSNNCMSCHNIRPPTMYSVAQWVVFVHHMCLLANITGKEQRSIVVFLVYVESRLTVL